MDQGSTMKRSAVHNFAPTVTKFCVMWEGQAHPHDTKFGNSRCEIVDRRVIFIWSLIHGLRWSGLIKAEPGKSNNIPQILWGVITIPCPSYLLQAHKSSYMYTPGVGVTKPISSVPLFSKIFSIVKTHVSSRISRSYLAGVAAAQLRWHLSNINVIQILLEVLLPDRKFCLRRNQRTEL